LHATVSLALPLPQAPLTYSVTLRSRVLVPPAHSAEQALQSSHSPSTQSSGQACVLQGNTSSTSVRFTSQDPPYLGGEMVRFRVVKPPPHSCVHSENAVQLEMPQSSGAWLGSGVG
jgi:hypothetical protein